MDALTASLPHLKDVRDLADYERNARTHSPEQLAQIKESFRRFGFCGVIGYAGQGLKIGHGRRTAAMEMWADGEKVWGPGKRAVLPDWQLPAIDVSGLSDDDLRALVIADNKLALNAGWDEAMLQAEIEALIAIDFDIPILGFDQKEIDKLMGLGDLAKSGAGKMAAEFLIPPFSVLNAREGWWQDRKRQWLELGIKSEVGRGDNLLRYSDTLLEPDPEKREAMRAGRGKAKGRTFGQDMLDGEGGVKLKKGVRRSTGAEPDETQPGQRERPAGLGGVTMQSLSSHPRYYEQKTAAEARVGRKLTPEEFERDHWVEPDSEIISGTSIFDPVLCELVYRWFAPKGGQVLDPFAGGSVRGIVAAALGRRYFGIDLRPEQIAANEEQWPAVSAHLSGQGGTALEVPPLRVDEIEGIRVVRDDLTLGGTKRRALDSLIDQIDQDELIYATPAYGFAQIALAASCRAAGKKATVVVAGRKARHPRTQLAERLGAEIVEVEKGGYLTTVQKRASDLAFERGAYLVPFGMEDEIFIEAIANVARELGEQPKEVWCVAGSGVLSRSLQRAWPEAQHHAVQIGKEPSVAGARLWKAPEKFEDPAQDPPPWPSCDNYDAKAWRFLREHAGEGALFWNLGADISEPTDMPAPEWRAGDSGEVLAGLQLEADLVFSCPPYGDLEVYSDDPADLSTMSVADFDARMAEIVKLAVERLKPDRFAAFVVGDYRGKGPGFYRNFISKTISAFEAAGALLYNEFILVTSVGSLPIRAAKQFRTTRKAGKTHQQLLVFCKGDPKRATEALGPVDVSAALAEIEPEDDDEA
jgi:hypothetical protein